MVFLANRFQPRVNEDEAQGADADEEQDALLAFQEAVLTETPECQPSFND